MKKLFLLALLAGFAYALYAVYPTPYRYSTVKGKEYRINRFTGEWSKRLSTGAWKSIEPQLDVSPSDRLSELGIENAAKGKSN